MTITKNFHPVVKYLIPISAKTPLDDLLQKFFIKYLGYAEIRFDDRDPNPHRPEAWRLVYPDPQSLPFMVAYRSGLSGMSRKEVGRLYLDAVKDRLTRAASQRPPALYIFTDGRRFVFFSADPFRNRDDRFDLSESTIAFTGNQEKVENLKRVNLVFSAARLGIKRPQVDFLFRTTPLSQDERFKAYVHHIRQELLNAALEDEQALAAVVRRLLDSELVDEKDRLKLSAEELYLRFGQGLGDALAGAVDTLLLRLILMRFVEAYYGQVSGLRLLSKLLYDANVQRTYIQLGEGLFQNPIDDLSEAQRGLAQVVDKAIHPDASRRRSKKNLEARQLDLFIPASPKAIKELAAEEEQRKIKLGGDFFLSDLAAAATALETRFLADLKGRGAAALVDFLGRTAEDSQWEFRYEDLRPQTIQDYYEESLGTAVQVRLNPASKELELAVTRSRRQQKEMGAFYTDPRLCRFMVEKTVKPLLEERLVALERAIQEKNEPAAKAAFNRIVGMRICDPTMGSAPFLRSAFDYLSEQYETIVRKVEPARDALPGVWARWAADWPFLTENTLPDENGIGRWEWHILRRMLYGVDIDLKAVCIASQTFALSSLRYLPQGERFPSFFSVNLKRGNALINPVRHTERTRLADKYRNVIEEAIRLRHVAATTQDYSELSRILADYETTVRPAINELIGERIEKLAGDITDNLIPFCWELEFPEVFFDEMGGLRTDAGFDVIIGNPPWDEIMVEISKEATALGFSSVSDFEAAMEKSPSLQEKWQNHKKIKQAWKDLAASDLFTYQKGGRHHNYWRMAIEVSHNLGTPNAKQGLVVPSGIVADDNGRAVRQLIFTTSELQHVLSFRKENEIFPDQHQAFSVFIWYKGKPTRDVRHTDALIRAEELTWSHPTLAIPIDLVKHMSPKTWSIPSVSNDIELGILKRLYAHPTIQEWEDRGILKTATGDYNLGLDKGLFRVDGKGIPLHRGDTIDQYELRPVDTITIWVDAPRPRNNTRADVYRIVWRDVAGMEDPHKLVVAVVPPNSSMGHTINVLNILDFDEHLCCYLVGVLNSLCLDWRVRQLAKSVHVQPTVLLQLPVPYFAGKQALEIGKCAAKLLYTNDRFRELARPLNVEGVRNISERQRLKNEIDARVALLYELTEEELAYIMSKFPKVEDEIKAGVLAEYRRLAQEAAHA